MLSLLCLVFFVSAACAREGAEGGDAAPVRAAPAATTDVQATGADGRPVTAWAASVRAALARRSHTLVVASRSALGWSEQGVASWYGHMRHPRHEVRRRTSSGTTFDPKALTAAHPTLPMGTRVLVRSQDTGRSVVVTVNDRGPFLGSRIIDLSPAAAAQLGMLSAGTAHVVIQTAPTTEVAQAEASDSSADAIAAAGPHAVRRVAADTRRH
ncbi:septal ring lytic transglycosylase RlpA family protein [Gluconacetobacter takamatsuzukensis]|uniref:Endolytic peptidoglycan transglycosylase RlpA n=2 Tax=Gluconacetobacter takamatsuzukensis TaxID=1286190 RepID=A0A7W4KBV0_9PROT|nr:septal ring lytic transglycosylase RlpA family protein [Gluconacetobacter takamatsuzukensis]